MTAKDAEQSVLAFLRDRMRAAWTYGDACKGGVRKFCIKCVQVFDNFLGASYNSAMKRSLAVAIYGYAYYVLA